MRPADLARYLSHGTPESSKRLIGYKAAKTLIGCQVALTVIIVFQAITRASVDGGLLTAWTFGGGVLAGLAGAIYRKPDGAPNG